MEKISKFGLYLVIAIGLIFITECKKDSTNDPNAVVDIEGNIYHMITIGTQTWMVENLITTKYNDGTAIPMIADISSATNLTTPGYGWPNNNSANKATHGMIYNWYAINTGKLCPKGWHVPTNDEWLKLITYLGGDSIAGGKLKETGTTHWQSPNKGATNESGFTALPLSTQLSNETFTGKGSSSIWWTSSEYIDPRYVSLWLIDYSNSNIKGFGVLKPLMFAPVRCLRDN